MFNQYYRLPELLAIPGDAQYIICLTDDVSDYALMQALRAPLLEVVVSGQRGAAELVVRLQAGFHISAYDSSITHAAQTEPQSTKSLSRTLGQGARLYASGGKRPAKLIERLRRGLLFTVSLQQDKGVLLQLDGDGTFELVSLEADLRLCEDPQVLQNAKSVLAREPEYHATAAALALLITELEQARRDLHEYLSGADKHPGLAAEALRLEPMLAQRRQWLLRQYAQSQERVHFSHSANDQAADVEQLQRLLKCYELLCPPDVNAMVQAIAEEN